MSTVKDKKTKLIKLLSLFLTLLTCINYSYGQINILEFNQKRKYSENITYTHDQLGGRINISILNNNANKRKIHYLMFSIRDIKTCPLNTKIDLKSKKDNIGYAYDYIDWTNLDKKYGSASFDGYIEFLELTDSTFKMNLNFVLLNDSGRLMKFQYIGQRSGKTKKTQEELTSHLIPLGLDSLISRLNTDWHLKETGKAYWIGYTDEMYAIASYKDSAISKLLNFISSSNNTHARSGAVYCLHLIGIDSKIIGRFVEKFTNLNARQALLSLIDQADLTDLVISLLARDPWQTDLPYLAELLGKGANRTLINALFRYWINAREEIPFRDSISTNIKTLEVMFQDSLGIHKVGEIITIYQETEDEQPVLAPKGMEGYITGDVGNSNWPDGYTYKANILNRQGDVFMQSGKNAIRTVRKFIPRNGGEKILEKYVSCSESEIRKSKCDQLNQLFYQFFDLSQIKIDPFSYCDFRDSLFHYMNKPNEMIICDLEVTRQRWLHFLKSKGF